MAKKENQKELKGVPPVVLAFRPDSYKVLESVREIKQWEKVLRERVGLNAEFSNLSGTCSECSSGGRTDDCDQD